MVYLADNRADVEAYYTVLIDGYAGSWCVTINALQRARLHLTARRVTHLNLGVLSGYQIRRNCLAG
jgi:hypothetical protein